MCAIDGISIGRYVFTIIKSCHGIAARLVAGAADRVVSDDNIACKESCFHASISLISCHRGVVALMRHVHSKRQTLTAYAGNSKAAYAHDHQTKRTSAARRPSLRRLILT